MAKGESNKEREAKARRNLAKARMKYELAQERQAQARERGKQEIRAAQLRAEKWRAKAASRVEKAGDGMARADAKLLEIAGLGKRGDKRVPGAVSPEAAADLLSQEQAKAQVGDGESALVLPGENETP